MNQNNLTLKEAFNKAKVGEFIKAAGEPFYGGNSCFYMKVSDTELMWSNGASGGPVVIEDND